MDRILNPKDEKQTIYEIYRACRLCGAGAGYKMPIIQNVVDLGVGVELRQKIKECVQIEVNHTDRMPPLICELCVDKVNDFYVFLNMCRLTNQRTRLRLGLPETKARDATDGETCILGVTAPQCQASEGEAPQHRPKKSRVRKEPLDVKIKIANALPSPKPAPQPSPRAGPQPRAREYREPSPRAAAQPRAREYREPSPRAAAQPRAREYRESSQEARWAKEFRANNRETSPAPKRVTRQKGEPAPATRQSEERVDKCELKRPRERDPSGEPAPPLAKKLRVAHEPERSLKPGPKSSKPGPKPSKPGPKSSKIVQKEPPPTPPPPPPPKATSKSQSAKPASRKDRKPSPPPPSKAAPSKTPSNAPPPSKTPSKAPPFKATPPKATPPKATPPKATAPERPKAFYCQICNTQMKNAQGFAKHNHMKHAPTFTSHKLACNACELWFPSGEEAGAHHRAHSAQGLPYKCTRCYGYFKLQQAYEDHFGEGLCLSVYEVPDVKCWRCWRTFPTSKLMDEHRCAGEDGRPGGKCDKCSRNYALLKNLLKHETTCTYKKKGEVTVDPEIQARLLPMSVRTARCDALLATSGHVDSSAVSPRYGLDSKCRYPYLSSGGPAGCAASGGPAGRAASGDEPIKKDPCSRWDTVNNENSASVDTDSGQYQVVSMTPIKTRKRLENEPHSDISAKLDKIIENILDSLGNESTRTSCSNDSDSILNKSIANENGDVKPAISVEANNALLTKANQGKTNVGIRNESPAMKAESLNSCSYDSDSIIDKHNDKSADIAENDDDLSDIVKNNEKLSENTCENILNDKVSEDPSEKLDVPSDKEVEKDNTTVQSENTSTSGIVRENDASMKEIDGDLKSLEVIDAAPNDVLTDDTIVNEETGMPDSKVNENIESSHNDNGSHNVDRIVRNKFESVTYSKDSSKTENDDHLTNEKDQKYDDVDRNNQLVQDSIESLNTEDKLGSSNNVSERIGTNDSEKMEVDDQNYRTETDTTNEDDNHDIDVKDLEKPSENDENLSKIDEITKNILKDTEPSQNVSTGDLDDKHPSHKDDVMNVGSHLPSVPHSDAMSELNRGESNGVQNVHVTDMSEDDRELMAELDAQVGETKQNISENYQKIDEDNLKIDENDQKMDGIDQKIHENDQKMDSIDQKMNSNDQKNDENDQKMDSNDQKIDENYQKMESNDQKIDENDLKMESIDQKTDENYQKMDNNDHIIGENDQNSKEHSRDDLLSKPDLRSLDLHSISDEEFDFDA